MPYKISGTKSETARIMILKESDWSIEYETVVSGSGAYEIDGLESGSKTVVARSNDGEMLGHGSVVAWTDPYFAGDRGVFGGGGNSNIIDYITISSTGDAVDFGDLTVSRGVIGATSNGVSGRGAFGGGNSYNTLDYITISTPSDAIDFGDLTFARYGLAASSNGTNDRGVFGGGYVATYSNVIDYITISSTGNAANFGDLTTARDSLAATSDA